MSSLKYVIFGILLLLLIGGPILFVYLQRQNSISNTPQTPTRTTNFTRPAVEVVTEQNNTPVTVGRSETISINLPSSTNKPTAFDLTFNYDNDLIEVINIVPGRLWSTSNVLRKVIDNETGTLRLAAGQGFNSQETSNVDLVEIEYKVLKAGEATFELTSESVFAFVGDNELSPVTSDQIIIRAEN